MIKKILLAVLAIVIVVGSILLEGNTTNEISNMNAKLIELPQDSDSYEIRTDANNAWHQREKGETPRYIRSKSANLITFAEEIRVAVASDSIIKLVQVNNDLVHLKVIEGQILFDRRYSNNNLYIQTQDLAVVPEPFSRGILDYQNNIINLSAINGHLDLGIISDDAEEKLYLTEGQTILVNELTKATPTITSNTAQIKQVSTFPQIKLDAYLRTKTTEAVNSKQTKNIILPKFLQRIIINPVKRNAIELNNLATKLDAIRESYQINQVKRANTLLIEFEQDLSDLATSDRKAVLPVITSWLQLYGSIEANSVYLPIKEVILGQAGIILNDTNLLNYWSFAADTYPEWTKPYISIFSDEVKSMDGYALTKFHQRLLYQFSQYPEKNTEPAYDLLNTVNDQLLGLELISLESNLKELSTQIKTIQSFESQSRLTPDKAAPVISAILNRIEAIIIGADFEFSLDTYLEEELPNINSYLRDLRNRQ